MMAKEEIKLQKPTEKLVEGYINKFMNESEERFRHYPFQEKAVMKIKEKFPRNDNIIEILLKVGILNSFYSTNIFKPFAVAERILKLDIDERLIRKDLSLINDISKNKISGKDKNFYSFATKYCSMHNPEVYPIYDSYIEWILMRYKRQYSFYDFNKEDLKDYSKFIEILKKFQEFFNLGKFSFKQIDQFLWGYAKEIKPNNYGRKKNKKQ
jgi:hypothetical protein